MQLLQPLRVTHIGLFAGHTFDVTGVDQIHVDARLGELVVEHDPVIAGALQCWGLDAMIDEPVA